MHRHKNHILESYCNRASSWIWKFFIQANQNHSAAIYTFMFFHYCYIFHRFIFSPFLWFWGWGLGLGFWGLSADGFGACGGVRPSGVFRAGALDINKWPLEKICFFILVVSGNQPLCYCMLFINCVLFLNIYKFYLCCCTAKSLAKAMAYWYQFPTLHWNLYIL